MRRTFKRVGRAFLFTPSSGRSRLDVAWRVKLRLSIAELDALGLDDEPIGEGETPSYLQDATALPDFVDSAPIEENHVSGALHISRSGWRVVSDR